MEAKKFYSIPQVADMLEVSPITIRRLIWNQKLEAVKVGKSIRIADEDIDTYMKKNKTKKKLSESEFSLEGMFTEGEPIPKEAVDEVIAEWERE